MPRRIRVAAWVLALTALAAPLTAVAAVVAVLTGAVDHEFFTTYTSDENGNETSYVDPSVDLVYRWKALQYIVPADEKLLGPVVLVAVLAGLHLAGHRVPGGSVVVPRGARWTAVAAAVVSTVLMVGTVGVPAVLRHTGGSDVQFPDTVPPLVDLASPLALSGALLVLAVVAVVLLLARPLPWSAAEDQDEVHDPWPPGDEEDEDERVTDSLPAPTPAVVTEEPPTGPPPIPRLADADRALYRRPAP